MVGAAASSFSLDEGGATTAEGPADGIAPPRLLKLPPEDLFRPPPPPPPPAPRCSNADLREDTALGEEEEFERLREGGRLGSGGGGEVLLLLISVLARERVSAGAVVDAEEPERSRMGGKVGGVSSVNVVTRERKSGLVVAWEDEEEEEGDEEEEEGVCFLVSTESGFRYTIWPSIWRPRDMNWFIIMRSEA